MKVRMCSIVSHVYLHYHYCCLLLYNLSSFHTCFLICQKCFMSRTIIFTAICKLRRVFLWIVVLIQLGQCINQGFVCHSRDRRYLRLPIRFTPTQTGTFQALLTLHTDIDTTLTVTLLGVCSWPWPWGDLTDSGYRYFNAMWTVMTFEMTFYDLAGVIEITYTGSCIRKWIACGWWPWSQMTLASNDHNHIFVILWPWKLVIHYLTLNTFAFIFPCVICKYKGIIGCYWNVQWCVTYTKM